VQICRGAVGAPLGFEEQVLVVGAGVGKSQKTQPTPTPDTNIKRFRLLVPVSGKAGQLPLT
jgi:hypothetical protein